MLDPTRGSVRELIDADEVTRLRQANALVLDSRLHRPFYFDGRFLTAQDLTREQNYFLVRQADLGRAGGVGVLYGLTVTQGDSARSLRIAAGDGVTPLGELVVLPQALDVDLTDIPTMQRLNAAFGLATIPRDPARNRTGIFIVALRPVEYTANPVAAYPTAINAARTVNDSEIIEAVAVTLIPYLDTSVQDELALRRAQIAHRIFVQREGRNLPGGVLPLAMVALNRGMVEWIDMHLVRREVGAEQQDILGLGYAARSLRESHVQQYNAQMAELVQAAAGNAARLKFAATDRFLALPPVGRLPAATITADFTQTFFPSEVDVTLSFVPEDEIPALVEDGLLLPPIDLTLHGNDQESTAVLILVPVTRGQIQQLSVTLEGAPLIRALRPAAPGLVANRLPLEVLRGIRLPRLSLPPVLDKGNIIDAAWRSLLTQQETLWFVRQRNLSINTAVVGFGVPFTPDQPQAPQPVLPAAPRRLAIPAPAAVPVAVESPVSNKPRRARKQT